MKSAARIVLIAALILPRLLRLMYPSVQIEDPNYIYGAFLLLIGKIPFLEFAQPNPPLLESLVACLYMIFGVTYRIPELLSGAAFFGISIMIWRIGARWFSERAGILAALLFAWHYLPFRYHLFERETFATLAFTAVLLLLSRESHSPNRAWLAGALAGLAYLCKQTALIPFAGLLGVMTITPVYRRSVLRMTVAFLGVVGLFTAIYSGLYGVHYLRQTFWFHFIKGSVAPWTVKSLWTFSGLGFTVPLALGSLALIRSPSKSREWIPGALIAADLCFFWFVTGAFWPHYLLSTLVPITLLAGRTLDALALQSISTPRRAASGIILAVCLGTVIPLNPMLLLGAGAVENYGFQGTPRQDVEACSSFVKNNSSPFDLMTSDPFIALECQRIEVVNFKDNWGLVLWMNEMIDRNEYDRALETMSASTFGDIRLASHRYWMPQVERAFQDGRIGVIIPNYELPLSPEWMLKHGFERGFQNSSYDVWVKRKTASLPEKQAPGETGESRTN